MAERLIRGAGCRLYSVEEAIVYHLDHPARGTDREQSAALLAELRQNFIPIRNGGPMLRRERGAVPAETVETREMTVPSRPRVSLAMIAKNEEANLCLCLMSVADLVDEMIVVDTGSTDRTKEMALACGARVFDFAWVESFAAARNESLRHATGDWILWLDGDEHFNHDSREKLRTLFAGLRDENCAYVMKQQSTPDHPGGSDTLVDQVRLFRNHPSIRWRYRVHEQILPALREAAHEVRFTDILLEHTGYQDPALRRQKTQRNLQLLQLEAAEQPDDPFTLFNLGWAYHGLGETAKALPLLRRSLALSQPGDSIIRKLYVLLAQAHRQLGQEREALAACRAGRARCPDDAELLFLEGQMLRERGNFSGAESCWRQFLQLKPAAHFASVDAGLHGNKTRYHLGQLYQQQGCIGEAENQWRAIVATQPRFGPAWQALAELYVTQKRWPELETAITALEAEPCSAVAALVLRARGHLARQEFGPAQQLLEEAIARDPHAEAPRVFLTHLLLQTGQDAGAEQALRQVLERNPRHAPSWNNLVLALRSQNRLDEALAASRVGQEHCPGDGSLLFLEGMLLQQQGDLPGAESCLLQLLETTYPNGDRAAQDRSMSARHQLARMYRLQRRFAEAESQWRAVVADGPVCQDLPQGRLRLAFASFSPFAYTIDTPYRQALGGSESALCYLAEALAQQGHEVFLLNANPAPTICRGVRCLPLSAASIRQMGPLDAMVVQNLAGKGQELRALLPPFTVLVFWCQHAHDQPAVQPLHDAAERQAYDRMVFVSDWQRQQFVQQFGLDPERTLVLRNAIGPAFTALFAENTPILAQKVRPPVLAYTSTPFRGLELLLDAFPRIRQAVPGTIRKIFSSMQVYQIPQAEEEARYGTLYRRCRETEGVEYIGSLPQPELAGQLRAASVLAYPNTFAETYCIAVLEAMASGCRIITSDLGALPETSAGFAHLIPMNGDRAGYLDQFAEETIRALQEMTAADPVDAERCLRRQVDQINQHCVWPVRAQEWLTRLRSLLAASSRPAALSRGSTIAASLSGRSLPRS
jgi:tetratricopeptide (TPR) repeat protein